VRPIVSFGIPVFNGEKYLEDAIASIQEQRLSQIEIIISDNGSTDATEQICRRAAEEDDRIKYLRSPTNRGGSWNYNNVWLSSTAPYFSWMAADDIKLPEFASSCVEALEKAGGDAAFSCPRTQLIDGDGVVFEDLNDERLGVDAPEAWLRIRGLLRSQASHLVYGVIRADALRQTRSVLPIVGDDMVLLTELLCQGRMAPVKGQYFWQRRHAEQFSAKGDSQVKWHDPHASVSFSFPQLKMDVELCRAVIRSDLSLLEKLKSLGQIGPSWAFPRWRGKAHDFVVAGQAARRVLLRRH
jgi:glycosyltransferase involved in cell wall biosynthesis